MPTNCLSPFLAAPRIYAGSTDRTERNRHRPFLCQYLRFKARRPSAVKHAMPKIDGRELLDVLLHRALGHCPAVEEETGRAPSSGFTIVGRCGHDHGGSSPSLPRIHTHGI